MTVIHLPRLLYVGDVPVESSYHGSVLLFRLLQDYPPNRLRVIEGNTCRSLAERRLPGVAYNALPAGYRRLLDSRLHRWYSLWLSATSAARARSVPLFLDGFWPDAVMTVAHGHSWVTAAEFAARHHLPLHLIVHDDWPRVGRSPRPFADFVDRQFKRVYRAASSRLCESPFMVEEYARRYGAEGQVLYPSRARHASIPAQVPDRVGRADREMVFAFAGTLSTPDYSRLLRLLAKCLEPLNSRLLIFGPMTNRQAAAIGLVRPNIHLCGLLNSDELVDRLRADVDVLFVPMSFTSRDRANMETSFPSKLADYTAVGLPLLICGPRYCSAVRWARDNPGVAEVVDSDDAVELRRAVDRLVLNPEHRAKIAERALTVGERYFSYATASQILFSALTRIQRAECDTDNANARVKPVTT